jgi:hypothetical protein
MAWNRNELNNFSYHIYIAHQPLHHLSPTQLQQRAAWVNRSTTAAISPEQEAEAINDLLTNHRYSPTAARNHCQDMRNMLALPAIVPLDIPFRQSDVPMVHALDATARSMNNPVIRAATTSLQFQFWNYHRAILQQRLSNSVDMMENWGEGGTQNPPSSHPANN